MAAADVQAALGFSDAVRDRLQILVDLVRAWKHRVNLVSDNSLVDIWRRHVLDSAQLVPLLPCRDVSPPRLVDLGSGAGFPGLVIAIAADMPVTLIESDGRKCAFLGEAARLTESPAEIVNERIEQISLPPADIVTARACAPLPKLLSYTAPLLKSGGFALFLKGRAVDAELTRAEKNWTMRVDCIDSRSDPSGVILRVSSIAKRS